MSQLSQPQDAKRHSCSSGLRLMEVRPHNLVFPSLLQALDIFLGILILATWLPLLHLVIANEFRLGRRLQVLENVLPAHADKGFMLALLAGTIMVATVIKVAGSYWAERIISSLSSRAESVLGEKIIRRHLRFGQEYFDSIKPGKAIKSIIRLPARASRLIRWMVRLFSTVLVLSLYVLFMVWLSPELAGLSIVLLTVYHLFIRRLLNRSEARMSDEEEFEDAVESDTRDLVENLLLLRLHAPEVETVQAFRAQADQRATLKEKRDGLIGLMDEVREGGNVLIMLVFVLIAGWALNGMGSGDIARYLVFFIVFRRAMRPFANLQRLPRQWKTLSGNLDEVAELLADEGKAVVAGGSRRVDQVSRGISVRRLNFAYNNGVAVLHDVSFEARKGELTILVGPNGSGKSTMLKLFMRMYDAPVGTVFLDQVDLREFDLESLRKLCGYTGAEPLMLNGSLRDNLTIGLDAVNEEQLRQVAAEVGMDSLITALEGGMDHEIGNRGMRLSQGQRQKVALARVLLRCPAVIFLDEASSSFDVSAEKDMMRRLVDLAADRVIVAVTHRVSCIPPDAHVVVFNDGRVVEDGYGRELESRGGWYKQMLDAVTR